ncbi:hypothetical protein [Microseira sp. BLCC-F43]|uniref:hypothetical protein n=1 Tax=Microseira sp. BLCC-F43 TaxID=3153602 RepID=UPI0035B9DA4E
MQALKFGVCGGYPVDDVRCGWFDGMDGLTENQELPGKTWVSNRRQTTRGRRHTRKLLPLSFLME